jgi:hypothetical protein
MIRTSGLKSYPGILLSGVFFAGLTVLVLALLRQGCD